MEEEEQENKQQIICIYSDSQEALKAVNRLRNRSTLPQASKDALKRLLRNRERSHYSGFADNERAVSSAKLGSSSDYSETESAIRIGK